MKTLILSVCMLVFIGCETTVLTNSICGSDRVDLKGFDGNLTLTFGTPESFPVKIVRESRGEYRFEGSEMSPGEGDFKFIVCSIEGEKVAEIPVDAENGTKGTMLMNLTVTRKAFIFKSAIVDQEKLSNASIPFTFGETEVEEGQPLTMSYVEIKNSGVSPKQVLSTRGNPEGKLPFGLTFLK